MNMNREILRIALPNIVSNITVPLMGIVSTAIAGHWGADSAATIGALAIGVSIFNFIYWNCSFVRMGTSGLTAQAFGAGDFRECTNMLARALSVSAVMGVLMILLQYPVGELALWAMNGSEMTRDYFYARIWAVPAGIVLFGFNGWFTGMQNAIFPMLTAVTVNIVHILCSLWFAFGMDMGIVGIAYASVIAQWTGVALSALLLAAKYRPILTGIDWSEVLDLKPLKTFFIINRDIILRTFCIVAVYTFFTGASARMDDPALLAVNTLGVIYLVEKGGQTVTDWASLKGQTIYATGKGSTPEYALNYLLEENGLDPATDVTIEWKSEPTEIVAQMAAQDHVIALLPQPFVTVAQSKFEDLAISIDLTEEWDKLDNGSQLITAGLVVRTEFAKEHPQAVADFLEEYNASTAYVNENVAEAAQLVEQYDIVEAAVAEKAIPYCNIVCITGQEMMTSVQGYFQVLFDQNPQSVGGTLPGDDFYYLGQ